MTKTITLSPISLILTLALALALVLGAGWSIAHAGSVHPGAYDTAIQKGVLSEPAQGYDTGGYRVEIDLDEEYHDWEDRRVADTADRGRRQEAEFAAFETQGPLSVPWELGVVD